MPLVPSICLCLCLCLCLCPTYRPTEGIDSVPKGSSRCTESPSFTRTTCWLLHMHLIHDTVVRVGHALSMTSLVGSTLLCSHRSTHLYSISWFPPPDTRTLSFLGLMLDAGCLMPTCSSFPIPHRSAPASPAPQFSTPVRDCLVGLSLCVRRHWQRPRQRQRFHSTRLGVCLPSKTATNTTQP